MRFPSWSEFTEKLSNLEKEVSEKIIKFQENHPLLDKALLESLGFLPPPFNMIAQNIYNGFEGTKEEKSQAVIKYLNELKEQGQKYFEKTVTKLDVILIEIEDVKEITIQQINKIEDILQSSEENQQELLSEFKKLSKKMGKVEKIITNEESVRRLRISEELKGIISFTDTIEKSAATFVDIMDDEKRLDEIKKKIKMHNYDKIDHFYAIQFKTSDNKTRIILAKSFLEKYNKSMNQFLCLVQ